MRTERKSATSLNAVRTATINMLDTAPSPCYPLLAFSRCSSLGPGLKLGPAHNLACSAIVDRDWAYLTRFAVAVMTGR